MKKRILQTSIILTFILTGLASYGQESVPGSTLSSSIKLEHEKKSFKGDDGKLYWNVELPVYINLSTGVNSSNFRLQKVKNKEMEAFSYPMYFDGHGVHYIRHKDFEHHVPENEVAFAVYVDGRKPISKSNLAQAPKYFSGNTRYYAKGVKMNLSATDEMSGLDKIYYEINGSGFKAYSNELPFDNEGSFATKYYSVDRVGNVEKENIMNFEVDGTPPSSTLEVIGDRYNDILSSRSKIKMEATDAKSGVKSISYSFDDQNEKKYYAKINLTSLSDGYHVLSNSSLDNVENKENIKDFKFYLDKLAPTVSSEVLGDFYQSASGKNYFSEKSSIKLIAEDNKAGVAEILYSINGRKEQVYSEPFLLEGADGGFVIKYRAKDNVNNYSKSAYDKNVSNVYLDKTAPIISHYYATPKVFARDTMFITSNTAVNLKASDYKSGVQKITYTIDNGQQIEYSKAFNLDKDGFHSISYIGLDNVNNEAKKSFILVVDNTGPETFSHFSINKIGTQKLDDQPEPIAIYPKNASLYLAATDHQVGTASIFYKLDNGAEKLYTGPIKVNRTGLRRVDIRAVDKLGNETKAEAVEFVIQ